MHIAWVFETLVELVDVAFGMKNTATASVSACHYAEWAHLERSGSLNYDKSQRVGDKSMMRFKFLTLAAAAFGTAVAAMLATATAAPITAAGALIGVTQVIDFSQFTCASSCGANGPTQIGGLVGLDVTAEDTSGGSNMWLYDNGWGLNDNGNWNSGRDGFLGIFPGSGPVRITFNDGPISGFGFFMNYPTPGFLPNILRAFDSGGALLETFDVGATAPISTPGGTNAGGFRGIQRASTDIAFIEMLGDTAVYDDLIFTASPSTPVPEPTTLTLLGLALLGLGAARGRRKQAA